VLQSKLALEPHGASAPLRGIPAPAAVPDELAFFEQLRTWMQAFPPSEPDQAYQQRFALLGLLDAASLYADCPPELFQALTAGEETAKQQMETTLKKGGLAPVVNGWTLTFHMFDYNLDHLGPGTIDDRRGPSPTGTPATCPGRWPPGVACGATTDTRRPIR
jgi:hypothetical protein